MKLMGAMHIEAILTRVLMPPKDDLLAAIQTALPRIRERSIIVVTSKVVSIWQGRCVARADVPDKDALIMHEAERYLPRALVPGEWVMHTIKHNLMIPTAGIDESNANDYYVLWPEHPKQAARQLYEWVRTTYGVKDIGILITDSHSIPLRRGSVGISLSHAGFAPLRDYRKTKDLFGRELKITMSNIVDSLAAAAVIVMGEGAERTPLALISDAAFVEFSDQPMPSDRPYSSLEVDEQEDLYHPFIAALPWQRGGGGLDTA